MEPTYFPPGFTSQSATVNGDSLGPGWGWATHLLPYIEQDNLYRTIRIDLDITNPANAAARVQSLPIYLCPSDNPKGPTFMTVDGSGNPIVSVAFANYVGVGGIYEVSGFPDTDTGVLLRNSKFRVTDITDGSSNTLCVTERHSGRSPMTTWVGAVTGCINPPLNPGYDEEAPATLCLANIGEPADARTPNNPLDHVEDPSSRHTGGINALFGDGSVRFIRNSIDPYTWSALDAGRGRFSVTTNTSRANCDVLRSASALGLTFPSASSARSRSSFVIAAAGFTGWWLARG